MGFSPKHLPANSEICRMEDLSVKKLWSPPPLGFFKINVDASWCSSPSSTGLGLAIWDDLGSLVAISTIHLQIDYDAPLAEVVAIKGLKLAISLFCCNIIVESDCLQVGLKKVFLFGVVLRFVFSTLFLFLLYSFVLPLKILFLFCP